MNRNFEKYAELLLKRCLNLNTPRPLLVTAPIKAIDFVEILTHKAYELGITDIYYDWSDENLKHEQLLHLSDENLLKSPFWSKEIWDEYAKKDAAFLMLYSDDIDLMSDVPEDKITLTANRSRSSRPLFKKRQRVDEVPWCIALVPTLGYAKKVFPNSADPVADAWDAIFKCCLVYEEDPIKAWDEKVKKIQKRCDILNDYQFKSLHYINSLGTDLTIELPENHIWSGAGKGGLIVNIIALLIASVISAKLFWLTLVICCVCPQIDSYIIAPKVYGKTNNIHPLISIFAVFAGGILGGFIGIIISLPLTIIIITTFKFFRNDIDNKLEEIKDNKK